jgi:uncharacterized protein YegL
MNLGNKVATAENFEEKTLCVIVLDDSYSMSGKPVEQLNKALAEFKDDIENDMKLSMGLEIAIVKFGSDAETIQQPTLVNGIKNMPILSGDSGLTSLKAGVRKAISIVEDRKSHYKQTKQPYKRPWIVLLTDGAPTDGNIDELADEIEQLTKNGSFMFLPIGVDGADMQVLNQIAGYVKKGNGKWDKTSALSMESAKFSEFFEWLSASMSIYHNSKDGEAISMPDPSGWMKGFVA